MPLAASVRVDGRALELRVARRQGVQPGACGGLTDCFRLARVGPLPRPARPEPPPQPQRAFDLLVDGPPASGRPDHPSYTSSSGAGRVTVPSGGSFLVFDTYADESLLVAVRVAARVAARVAVSRSTVPGCAAGATGTLDARDGPDRIVLAVCGLTRAWTGTASVTVRTTASRP